MDKLNLEEEIKRASKRIDERSDSIEKEIKTLESLIFRYTKWAWGFVWAGIVISAFSLIYFLLMNTEEGFSLNLLGDFLSGSVASIWSLAGLFFIYVAFLGQKQQLLNQQLELMYSQLEVKYTRLELAGQKQEMKEQNATLRQQKFENTFFQLIALHNSNVNSIEIKTYFLNSLQTTTGKDCFEQINKFLNGSFFGGGNNQKVIKAVSIEVTLKEYDAIYEKYLANMSSYLRTIYHIFKFIDGSDIENKKQYISITRAQLSSYEQILLFYNCLHENGRNKFKPLIEKYAIFKNFDYSLLLDQEHKNEYSKEAYGE